MQLAYARNLGSGPEAELADRRCLSCHAATLITQQRKDSTAWAKTIAQMEAWSAPLPPGERDSLLRYLVSAVGPRAGDP